MDAANTAGAIAGSLFFSLVFLPRWGSALSQRLFILLSLAGAFLAWLLFWKKWFSRLKESRYTRIFSGLVKSFRLNHDCLQAAGQKFTPKTVLGVLGVVFFFAGWGLYSKQETSLLSLLWSKFRFPEEFFIGPPQNLQALRKAFAVD